MQGSKCDAQPVNVGKGKKTQLVEKDSHAKTKLKRVLLPCLGIFCVILGEIFNATHSVVAKTITSIHPMQIGTMRFFTQFLILLPILQFQHKKIDITGPPGKKLILWLRGFLGSTALIFLYLAIDKLSVGNAATLTFLNTVIVPVLGKIFLKESLTVVDGVFAIVAMIGVVLIAQPPFLFPLPEGESRQSPLGIIYGVICAFCASFAFITIRKLGKETHCLLNVLYFSFVGGITTTTFLIATRNFSLPCLSEVPQLFALGVIGIFGQTFLTISLQWERVSTVSVLRAIQIILVFTMQVVFLKDIPSFLSLLGAGLIFSCSVGIGIRRIVNETRRRKRSQKRPN